LVDRVPKPCYTRHIATKELAMVKLIGWIAVIWFLFHFGIAQALLLWTAAMGTIVFG
jgi:hypothetical protein